MEQDNRNIAQRSNNAVPTNPNSSISAVSITGWFNQYGTDAGLSHQMTEQADGTWTFELLTEWPTTVAIDATQAASNGTTSIVQDFDILNGPAFPALAWQAVFDKNLLQMDLIGIGSQPSQILIYALLVAVPVLTASIGILLFMQSYYQVKFNKYGVTKRSFLPFMSRSIGCSRLHPGPSKQALLVSEKGNSTASLAASVQSDLPTAGINPLATGALAPNRRRVLIATMEYDIENWKIKIKIGGLGVMAQLMGKNLGHQDLIWVVPCVGDVEYPPSQNEADPMVISVLGSQYDITVHTHILRNITYVLLDAPVFRKQTKSDPYPERMDDLNSAIYYSAWNQCIAEALRRYEPHLYHINDYHGAIAPLYLLPQTIPCCLSLHNAEFQGLWPMRNEKETEEVCKTYNLSPDIVKKYVQFGEVFNLLHAGATYLRNHQKGFGAVGVSKKYSKRSYSRYPIFWGLQAIGALPNPDPSDTAEWNPTESIRPSGIQVDEVFEASRGDLRKQAQEWAGLNVDPDAELFVFVGRWSMQKGIDLIADVFPKILDNHSNTQLICIGPVVDLYGRFAAIKLDRLITVFPGRVFSRPEFTTLPPYIFSGAEFALIPSRDEPFGLVAVEFGRKGALGVGARVGGLGQMPGWWFTVESLTTKHMLSQFENAIDDALASKKSLRAELRARSAKQRFPVAQWVEELEILQTTAIQRHDKYAMKTSPRGVSTIRASMSDERSRPLGQNRYGSQDGSSRSQIQGRPSSAGNATDQPPIPRIHISRMGSIKGPGHVRHKSADAQSAIEEGSDDQVTVKERATSRSCVEPASTWSAVPHPRQLSGTTRQAMGLSTDAEPDEQRGRSMQPGATPGATESFSQERFMDNFDYRLQATYDTPPAFPAWLDDGLLQPIASPEPAMARVRTTESQGEARAPHVIGTSVRSISSQDSLINPIEHSKKSRRASDLSVNNIVGDRKDFQLQNVAPIFKDQNQDYAREFTALLGDLNGKNSRKTCIEEYIEMSEKDWFNRYREVRLGKRASSMFHTKAEPNRSITDLRASQIEDTEAQFALRDNYMPPRGARRFLLYKVGDWPVYSFLLALGQIMAANSFQVTLLTGQVGGPPSKLYTVSGVYLAFSVIWWLLFRRLQSRFVLASAFFFYGASFCLIGVAPLIPAHYGRIWNQDFGTGLYAAASASGSIFFALNFGEQGGSTVTMWVYRACIIQGTQQIYIAGLFWWASTLQRYQAAGTNTSMLQVTKPAVATSVGVSVGVVMFLVGLVLWTGLPDFYRQTPGSVPSFFKGIFRRKLNLWFFGTVLVQNFFLSIPYGRSWLYLWSARAVPTWQTALLALLFFVFLWASILRVFGALSKQHSWILPLFAIGLGAPRWAQTFWGTSGIGQYIPWAGSAVGSAFVGRLLWLWLGVLDSLQGVGFGMILLTTLTRLHVAFTLVTAQVIGAAATIVAQAVGPDRLTAGLVFPNLAVNARHGIAQPWFWVALALNLGVNFLAFKFFRKEQLMKP